ncbi:MAG: hypothetical protein KAX18_08200 [Candidatus Lokiarchaeota archaeon]|nr:hypothetical protein [Candidatus Lokiarchaeota archaeon]
MRLIHQETKLNFEYYRRKFIERRIKARMIRVDCNTLEAYYSYINSTPTELDIFLDRFSINYTYFFRNWDVFERLNNIIIECFNYKCNTLSYDFKPDPSKIKEKTKNKQKTTSKAAKYSHNGVSSKRLDTNRYLVQNNDYVKKTSIHKKINNPKLNNNSIKIWSCPCATGEEPYTIAMILNNLEKQIKSFPQYKIVASDIDKAAIDTAKIAVYNEDSVKETSKYFENRYFSKKRGHFGNKYVLTEDIKRKVDFFCEDITKGHKNGLKYDIILCRYLLIYFNKENREGFLKMLDRRLELGGLLILGKTETLFNAYNNFELVDARNHIYLKIR